MKNKKKVLKIVLIIISIIIFTILTVSLYIFKKNELEINEYKKCAIEYLYSKYKEEFDLESDSLGYKISKRAYYGLLFNEYNKEVRECTFKVKSKKIPIVSYITVWKNLTTNEIEINEINAKRSFIEDTSIDKNEKIYNEKMSIKNDLDFILKNYDDYEIDYNLDKNNYNQIYIKFNHSLIKELNNDLKNLKQVMDLTKHIDTKIKIEFLDYTTIYPPRYNVSYSGKNKEKDIEEGFEEEKKYFNFVKEVYTYLSKNGFKIYSVEKEKYLNIHFYFIYDEIIMKKNINELQEICKKYEEFLTLYFINKIEYLTY